MKVRTLVASLLSIGTLAISMNATAEEPIRPIKPAVIKNADMVELGKMLFFDPRLSKSGFISCNSCHNLSMGGTDNIASSIGHKWFQGPINAPTVLNSSMSLAQFWDGRAKDLKEQAGGPIANPGEMGSTHKLAIDVIQSIPQYHGYFEKAFGSKDINIDRVTEAIAAFEETLVTPNSRFDKWLKGDKAAITPKELEGYELFKSTGCVTCHFGEAVGGSSYQKLGVHSIYVTTSKIEGRKAVTGKDEDLNVYKVPTLRNIELTYPYFHDGAVTSLEEAVKTMGKVQLNKDLSEKEIDNIVAFLKTLTGDQPIIKLPILPPSNNNTPKPVPF